MLKFEYQRNAIICVTQMSPGFVRVVVLKMSQICCSSHFPMFIIPVPNGRDSDFLLSWVSLEISKLGCLSQVVHSAPATAPTSLQVDGGATVHCHSALTYYSDAEHMSPSLLPPPTDHPSLSLTALPSAITPLPLSHSPSLMRHGCCLRAVGHICTPLGLPLGGEAPQTKGYKPGPRSTEG